MSWCANITFSSHLDLRALSARTRTAPPHGARLHCEVLIAGTHDLATGAQHTIYLHMEQYITNRPADTQLVVATMPHSYGLQDPDNIFHDKAIHDIQMVRLDTIIRKYFTRHGLHLAIRDRRLLAEMLVRCLSTPRTHLLFTHRRLPVIAPEGRPWACRAAPSIAPPPVPTQSPSPSSPTPSLSPLGSESSPSSLSTPAPRTLQYKIFYESVAAVSFAHQNAQMATNKAYELTVIPTSMDLNPDLLVLTEHSSNDSNIEKFEIPIQQMTPTRVTVNSATAIDNVITDLTDVEVLVVDTAISDHYGQQANGHEAPRGPTNPQT
ncbi:hypothetical protein J6590_090087 [Homalodisca vitripennis]|nr:hypothetical protein J6590_090087 [Homalodisca vitripennis]